MVAFPSFQFVFFLPFLHYYVPARSSIIFLGLIRFFELRYRPGFFSGAKAQTDLPSPTSQYLFLPNYVDLQFTASKTCRLLLLLFPRSKHPHRILNHCSISWNKCSVREFILLSLRGGKHVPCFGKRDVAGNSGIHPTSCEHKACCCSEPFFYFLLSI